MKKIIAILLTLVMIFSFAACGGSKASDKMPFEASFETADIKVTKAELRDPYDDGAALVVYYEYTNKEEAKNYAGKAIRLNLYSGDTNIDSIEFLDDVAPEEQGNEFKYVEPGEKITACLSFSIYNHDAADEYKLTIRDYFEKEEAFEFTLDMSEVTEFVYE